MILRQDEREMKRDLFNEHNIKVYFREIFNVVDLDVKKIVNYFAIYLSVKDVAGKIRTYNFVVHNKDDMFKSAKSISDAVSQDFSEYKRADLKQVATPTDDVDMALASKFKYPDVKEINERGITVTQYAKEKGWVKG